MRHGAFTLIELTVALAISGLLAVASLAVATGMSRSAAAIEPESHEASLRHSLDRLLEADLLHADRFRKVAEGFEVQSHSALDRGSCRRDHTGCTIAYVVRSGAGGSWLIRRQTAGKEVLTELVCGNVGRIGIADGSRQPGNTSGSQWKAMPQTLTVTVSLQGRRQTTMDFSYRTR